MTPDQNLKRSYGNWILKRGVSIEIRRVTGAAPNSVAISKSVLAIVQNFLPDSFAVARQGYSGPGAISQGDRRIIVMADDLAATGFPLPIKKNDTVILDTGDKLNVTQADAQTRAMVGAIEIVAAGV